MAKKTQPPKQHVSQADALRLGADVANAKAGIDPKAWKKMVLDAHARGRTIRSQLFESNQPDALRERTQSSLQAEAEKSLADAYKPAEVALTSEASRAQALSAKRAADNIVYRTWMEQQQAAAATQAAGAQQRYEQYLAGQQAAATQDLQGQARAAAQGTPGTVSDMKDSTAIKGLSADEKRSEANVANARAATAALIPAMQAQQQNLALATRGSYDAGEARRVGDENKDLTAVMSAREKLATSKAADVIKEFTRLKDNEYTKATGKRDYAAAAEKLGLESFKVQQQATQFDATLKIKTAKQKLDELTARQDKALGDARIKVDYDKIAASQGKAEADRLLKRELDHNKDAREAAKRADKKKAGGTPAEKARADKADGVVNNVLTTLKQLHASHPGGTVSPNGKAIGFREYLMGKGASTLAIDVAEDLRKNNGKLSAAGRAKARRLGITDPEKRFGVA